MIRVGGRQRNAKPGTTYGTRAEAERIAGGEETQQRQPGAHDPRAGRITWGEWANTWWPERRAEGATLYSDTSRVRTHVEPRWGRTQLAHIDRPAVQAWVRQMERSGLSPATVQRIVHTFSGSLHAAVLAGRLATNPCIGVSLPRIPSGDERFLTNTEAEACAFFFDEPWRSMFLVLCGTGMRWGELAALHWHRVLDDRLQVHLAWDDKSRGYKLPKDHETREVPLLDWIEPVLLQHRAAHPPTGSCGQPHPRHLRQRCHSSLVFPGAAGRPIGNERFAYHWRKVVGAWGWRVKGEVYMQRRVALKHSRDPERVWVPGLARIETPVRIHDTRHTFASWWLQAGGMLEELAPILGHSSVVITERYAHLAPDRHESARQRMAGRGPRIGVAPHLPHAETPPESNVSSLADRRRSEGA